MNDRNIEFYNQISIPAFKNFAEKLGFSSCVDMELLKDEVEGAQTILEIGAGYGRVVEWIIKCGYQKQFSAIEKSKVLFDRLREIYAVVIKNEDVLKIDCDRKVDLIIWMWSGFLEFSPEEQAYAMKQVAKCLNPTGKICIEIPHNEIRYVGSSKDQKYFSLQENWGMLRAYLPSHTEMLGYARNANLQVLECRTYKTPAGLNRVIYMLSHA